MIPRVLHFCCFTTDRGREPLPLHYGVAIRSACHFLRPEACYFYNDHEPTGPCWEMVADAVTRVACEPPDEVFGRPVRHIAHRTDVLRLQVLLEHGGVYLDMDTVCAKPWDDLLGFPSVMGLQDCPGEDQGALCNAVVLSEPGNPFLAEWYEGYRGFTNDAWDRYSVRLPYRLAAVDASGRSPRDDLHVEPATSFFDPTYSAVDLKRMFERDEAFPAAYGHHLWSGYTEERYFKRLTPRLIREVDTTYNRLARPFLPDAAPEPQAEPEAAGRGESRVEA